MCIACEPLDEKTKQLIQREDADWLAEDIEAWIDENCKGDTTSEAA